MSKRIGASVLFLTLTVNTWAQVPGEAPLPSPSPKGNQSVRSQETTPPARITTVDPMTGFPPPKISGGQNPRNSSNVAAGVQIPLAKPTPKNQ